MIASKSITAVALVFVAGSIAHAASSGTATGRLTFYQNQGNFCPTTRDCTGVNYLQSQYQVQTGVPETYIYVQDQVGNVIGQGSTDTNGNFSVYWTNAGPDVTALQVYWYATHKDQRFVFFDGNYNYIPFWTNQVAVDPSGTTNMGSWYWGSAGNPNAVANAYHGAWMEWARALAYSNRMVNNFNQLRIFAFSTNGGSCPTSCTIGDPYFVYVYLDPNSPYSPQARVTHEMGHAAGRFSSQLLENSGTQPDRGYSYCYPQTTVSGTCTANGWKLSPPTDEWFSTSFEEGVATFIGDVAFNWYNATQPHTCLSTSSCPTGTVNEETSGSCASDSNRWAVSVTKYLWDTYDTQQDAVGLNHDTISVPYYTVFDNLNLYGTAFQTDHSDEEPFDSNHNLVAPDQRNATDYRYWLRTTGVHNGQTMYMNCLSGLP